jgi:hypothetical protein
MSANVVKHRFTPMQNAFATQIGFSCQTHLGAVNFAIEYVERT